MNLEAIEQQNDVILNTIKADFSRANEWEREMKLTIRLDGF